MKVVQAIKHNILVLIVTAVFLIAAWGFWAYFQQRAFDLVYLYLVITLFLENRRLRALLRKRDKEKQN